MAIRRRYVPESMECVADISKSDHRSRRGAATGTRSTSTAATRSLPDAAPARSARPDGDGDGLYDDDEVTVYATDPLNGDTDGDGVGRWRRGLCR